MKNIIEIVNGFMYEICMNVILVHVDAHNMSDREVSTP